MKFWWMYVVYCCIMLYIYTFIYLSIYITEINWLKYQVSKARYINDSYIQHSYKPTYRSWDTWMIHQQIFRHYLARLNRWAFDHAYPRTCPSGLDEPGNFLDMPLYKRVDLPDISCWGWRCLGGASEPASGEFFSLVGPLKVGAMLCHWYMGFFTQVQAHISGL